MQIRKLRHRCPQGMFICVCADMISPCVPCPTETSAWPGRLCSDQSDMIGRLATAAYRWTTRISEAHAMVELGAVMI